MKPLPKSQPDITVTETTEPPVVPTPMPKEEVVLSAELESAIEATPETKDYAVKDVIWCSLRNVRQICIGQYPDCPRRPKHGDKDGALCNAKLKIDKDGKHWIKWNGKTNWVQLTKELREGANKKSWGIPL